MAATRALRGAVWLALAVGVFLAGLTPIADGDIFWHLAAGRQMVHTGGWIFTDPFSSGAQARSWVNVHWLFQIVVYAIERVGGLAVLVIVKAGAVAAGALVLLRVVEQNGKQESGSYLAPAIVSVGMIGALFVVRHMMPVRPIVVTLLCLALFFSILEGHRRNGQTRALGCLAVLQAVWVNCQGLWVLGPALILCFLAGAVLPPVRGTDSRQWRPLAMILAACLLVSFATPYGWQGVALPFKLLSRITPGATNIFTRQIAENIPPFVLEQTDPSQVWHLKWFLAALGASFILARGRVPVPHVFMVLGLTLLALLANRNMLLLYWLGTPIMAMNVVARAATWRRFAPAVVAALAVFTIGEITLAAVAFAREPSLRAPTPFRFPTESARLLAAQPPAAAENIFTADHQAGYLIWALAPRFKPFMDTRLVLRTPDEYAEYLDLLAHPERFDAFATQHGLRWAVLPTAYPDRYLELLGHLAHSPQWVMVFSDGSETLFARTPIPAGLTAFDPGSPATRTAIDNRFASQPRLHEAARNNLAALLAQVQR